MQRDAFKLVAKQALEQLTSTAERRLGRSLPRRFCFSWLAQQEFAAKNAVADFLMDVVYMDESHIWPCFDLFVERLHPDGRLALMGYRAAYPPCLYGEHWTYRTQGHDAGRVGPFKLGCAGFFERSAAVSSTI
jgi:hypothetical protein